MVSVDGGAGGEEEGAVPVMSRTGEVLGGLFFGHEQPGVFTESAEQIVSGIATQAAIAIENARLFQTAQAEIAERKRIEAELRIFNDTLEQRVRVRTAEIEARNRELQEFAYVASHDLQEPLRKVHAFSDLLYDEYASTLGEDGKDYLDRMRAGVLRMSTLIRDLLEYSRVSTRGQDFCPVDLNQIASEVINDLQVRIEETGGRIDVDPLPTLDADPTQMRQLLQNLIANALKFHRPDVPPVISIRSQIEKDALQRGREVVRLVVDDNGIGFEPQYAERIFVPFQRLHTRDKYEGTGIGLAICRRIVERHGGSISVNSTSGSGATFEIILPLHHTETPSA